MVQALTARERRIFQLCFQMGFLSYREIGAHLNVTRDAAKNLVGRILGSDRKAPLFTKKYTRQTAHIGIHPDVEKHILRGRTKRGEKADGAVAGSSGALNDAAPSRRRSLRDIQQPCSG